MEGEAGVTESLADHEYAHALASIAKGDGTPREQIEMLVAIAMRLEHKPKSPADQHHADALYDQALARCGESDRLAAARIRLRRASALSAIAAADPRYLLEARREIEGVLPVFREGTPDEAADAEMNLGVVIQSLAGLGCANIADAIMAYQRAARVFDRAHYPTEFALLHNNLATAYLSIPMSDARGAMREALAVQSFTEALRVVTLVDNPSEYAMLNNNLGNALQYARSGHPIENNLRALEAYEAALSVRNARDTPAEYANTLANKANCLRNLPDDLENPGRGNPDRLRQSRELYREAMGVFERIGDEQKAAIVRQALGEMLEELKAWEDPRTTEENHFGESRI